MLSDKIGRKPVAIAGMFGYLILFGMLLINTNITTAYILSFVGGAATSLFDGAINPAVMEIYPNHKSIASILNKGFISLSGVFYPLLIGFLLTNNLPVTISIWVPLVISIAILIGIIFAPFPDNDLKKEHNISASEAVSMLETEQSESSTGIQKVNPSTTMDVVLIVLFAFFIYSTFYLFQQVMSIYAVDVVGLSDITSRAIASYYQIGSFAAVILSAVLMGRGIRDMALLVVYPLFAGIAAFIIYLFPSEMTLTIGSFVIGYAAAGGALQLGNSLLNQFVDTNKGRNTSLYFFTMSIGSYLMPTIASYLQTRDFTLVMLLDGIVGIVAFVLMLIVARRYKIVFGVSPFSNSKSISEVNPKNAQ